MLTPRSLLLVPFVFLCACAVEPDDSASSGTDTGGAPSAGGATASGGASTGGSDTGGAFGSGASGGEATGGTGGTATGGSGTGGSGGADGETGGSGGAETGGSGGGSSCPYQGNITYTLAQSANPTPTEQEAYALITAAMDEALEYYNCYTNIERTLNVSYNSGVQTADGNPNGSIRFGQKPYMNHITAMHEISHVVGVGDSKWDSMIQNGIFPGPTATAELRAITGNPEDQVHGDMQHFWPYGLNQTSEVKSEQDLLNHCRMVMAIRADLGF